MARIKQEYANEDGWSDWIHPLPGYRMVCCDCGLSHGFEVKSHKGKIYFRMSRHERSTSQVRRHMNFAEMWRKITRRELPGPVGKEAW